METGEEEDEGDVIIKSFRNERKRESTENGKHTKEAAKERMTS